MPSIAQDIDAAARALIEQHGGRARQKVVDRIVLAVREHDIAAAKRWEEVGHAVDQQLAA